MNDFASRHKLILNEQDLLYEILPFRNPVCKQTYQSLPRIYGSKKTPKSKVQLMRPKFGRKQLLYSPKYDLTPDNLKGISRYLFPGKKKNIQYQKIPGASARVQTEGGIQTYRQYDRSTSLYKKPKTNYTQQNVKYFQLSDLETSHKVNSLLNQNSQRLRSVNQLQKLLHQKSRLMPIMQFQKHQQNQQNQKQQHNKLMTSNGEHKFKALAFNTFNNSQTQVNKLNSIKSRRSFKQIKQQNQEEPQQPIYSLHQKPAKFTNSETNSQSERSAGAVAISRHVFNQKRDPTMFRHLNKRISSSKLNSSWHSRIHSSLDNCMFRVPEQKQYRVYIEKYKPMSDSFSLLKLVKNKNFKIVRYENSVYFGEVNQFDQRNGFGVYVSEKQVFEGQYAKNLKVSGFEKNIDGVYIGGYKQGVRFGEGTFKWNNGEVFIGQWRNGMKNGFGKWRAPQGHYYEGQWSQNRQHGNGIFKHQVSTYKGQFKNFLKHGKGQQVFINGDRYKGQYQQGKPEGKGRYQWDKGGYYEGDFKSGKRQGYGIWIDDQGTKYQGQFADDYKHGRGKQIYKTGQKFQGIFQYGSKVNGRLYNKLNEQIEIIVK